MTVKEQERCANCSTPQHYHPLHVEQVSKGSLSSGFWVRETWHCETFVSAKKKAKT